MYCLLGAGGFKEDFKACLYVSSMEVGVCAEAYQGREPLRHINSAFMTFEVLDSNWKPRTLPRIRPEPVVSLILNPVSLKTHSANKWGKYEHPGTRISLAVFLVFYRMERGVTKKLSLERRSVLIGKTVFWTSQCLTSLLVAYQRADVVYSRYECLQLWG